MKNSTTTNKHQTTVVRGSGLTNISVFDNIFLPQKAVIIIMNVTWSLFSSWNMHCLHSLHSHLIDTNSSLWLVWQFYPWSPHCSALVFFNWSVQVQGREGAPSPWNETNVQFIMFFLFGGCLKEIFGILKYLMPNNLHSDFLI